MHELMAGKLSRLSKRFHEVGELLGKPDATDDLNKFKELSQEYAELRVISELWEQRQSLQQERNEAQDLMSSDDSEMSGMAVEEEARLGKQISALEVELQTMMVPKDKFDDNNIFLEIRMGTGGDEAAIFAGDLFRMYTRFCERNNWTMELLSHSAGEHGGYREIISRIVGKGAFSKLKFESGGHRVQRVPDTETQGRIHTSAATVAVLPELESLGDITIDPSEIRIDTFRASGAGGQHVNKTDSAIRITHLETGIVVECQSERSQHKNKSKAMTLLLSRLHQRQEELRKSATAKTRKTLIGSGDRSQRIRTYNFPQGRITDHRINLTLYKIDLIMDGDLREIITPLSTSYEHEALEELLDSMAS